MISVYICDDEPEWLKRIEKAVSCFEVQSDLTIRTAYVGSSPQELLARRESQPPLNGIYFLDIDLKNEMDGLMLGSRIRAAEPDAILIFVTTHEELMRETFRYRLSALDYIVKDQADLCTQICQALSCVEKQFRSTTDSIHNRIRLKTGNGYAFLPPNTIYYMDSKPGSHKTYVHTATQLLTVAQSLSELSGVAGKDFFLCRRGCLVNLNHIKETRAQDMCILLDNSELLQCSTRAWRYLIKRLVAAD